jgi:hypothetical protein
MTGNWLLEDFLVRFDEWCQRESPPTEIRAAVLTWLLGLLTNPYDRATRQLELGPEWWFAVIPETEHDGQKAVCFYNVQPTSRTARCSVITFLRPPFG